VGPASENFKYLIRRPRRQACRCSNTLFYTVVASVIKFALGLWLALLLNKHIPFKSFIRAIVLLPFIVPTALSAIAFWWLYDSQFSVISWTLMKMGLIDRYIDFLGEPWLARDCRPCGREHLARRAVRRDLPAGGGLRLSPPSLYERQRSTARRRGSASLRDAAAADSDHRGW
jgi:multiple sugar transport system permease protein